MIKKFLKIKPVIILVMLFAFGSTTFGNSNLKSKDGKAISVVVIDPGHGGKDFGASVGASKEKDIVLEVSKKLGNLIQSSYPEIKIIYTRSNDVFIPLHERANIANRNKADLFISVHVNATQSTGVQGTETFVLGQHRSQENLEVAKKENSVILLEEDYNTTYEGFDPNSPESYIMFELVQDEYLDQSVMLASDIQNQFRSRANRIDRSVKQAGFLVLRRTTMPSVLVEIGFISNANERTYLTSESGKNELAASIFTAFSEYKKKIEQKSNFTIRSDSEKVTAAPAPAMEKQATKQANQLNPETKVAKTDLFYSVQVGASPKKIEPSPSNFKGEKNIFRRDFEKISRYFSGKFETENEALKEKGRLEKKYPGCFIVIFDNGKYIAK